MTFTAGAMGGEYKHTLTINEMPSHRHKYTLAYGGNDPANGLSYGNTVSGTFDGSFIQYAGGGASHNNTQPYTVVYKWHRVS